MIATKHNTFSIEYNTRLPGFFGSKPTYLISAGGKIKTAQQSCTRCGSTEYVDNGYHVVEDSLVLALGLDIRIAQFCCKKCGCLWSSNREIIDHFVQKEKELVKSLMIGCVRSGLSFGRATSLIGKAGVNYSPQYLHELYSDVLGQVKNERAASASGIYYYDEQFLVCDGEEVCRLTIKDVVTGKVLVDTQTENAKKVTITRVIRDGLEGLPVEMFIFDMLPIYPGIIAELYPHAKIQWCIFHLDKSIWNKFQKEFGKYAPFLQLYNVYNLFDIFFDHTLELEKLTELLKTFNAQKTGDPKSDRELEKNLRKEFGKFVKDLKKQRRRQHQLIPRRTLEQSTERFSQIKHQILIYPKSLQERIRYIDDNWEKFTLFQHDPRVQPTSNGIEHYFAATLAKTDKKDFRSKEAVSRELAACQSEWNGKQIFSTTKLAEVLVLAGMLFLAFPQT